MGRQHQEMDRTGVRQVPEGSGEQGKMEKTGCKIICGAPTTLAVKGLTMMVDDNDEYFRQQLMKRRDHKNQSLSQKMIILKHSPTFSLLQH